MSRTPDEEVIIERFSRQYALGQAAVERAIERAVCGCDYGGTSWTTRREAEEIAGLLGLGPGQRLLDLGAGSGWPGLYVAGLTGCDVALVDVPLSGMRIAAERAAADRISGACWAVVADGADLPFRSGWFDAIAHSDVLCCLDAKLAVMRDSRRVIRAGGRMVFTVISIAPNLASADRKRAVDFGPPFVESRASYPILLREAGWRLTDQRDVTAEYAASVRSLLRAEEAHAGALRDLLGEAELTERLARRRGAAQAAGEGLLRRELFVAIAAAKLSVQNAVLSQGAGRKVSAGQGHI